MKLNTLYKAVFMLLFCVFATSAYSGTYEDDFACSTAGEEPVVVEGLYGGDFNCGTHLDVSRCGVCRVGGSSWGKPLIEVVYWMFGRNNRAEIAPGECEFIAGLRFCARYAAPNEHGNTSDKPQLCAYEDPWDGGEGDIEISPFHKQTPRENAISIEQGAIAGAAVGAVVGMGVLSAPAAAVGAAIGALVALGLQTYNWTVINDLGCIDVPMAVGPPAFCNDCWGVDYLPAPEISLGPDSTFLNSNVKLTFCHEQYSDSPIRCVRQEDGSLKAGLVEAGTLEFLELNAANDFSDTNSVSIPYKKHGVPKTDEREFKALVEEGRGQEICVYDMKGNKLQGCVERPGYMPVPTVKLSDSSTQASPKIDVYFNDTADKITIWQDPALYGYNTSDPGHECDTIYGVEFCATRRCLYGDPFGNPATPCTQWENKVCMDGYKTAPMTVVNLATDAPIYALPNLKYPKDVAFENRRANKIIDAAGEKHYLQMKLGKDAWIYPEYKCNRKDNEGHCLEYGETYPSGNEIPTGNNDPFFIDTKEPDPVYTARSMNAMELGLCADIQVGDRWVEDRPGLHDWVAPAGCEKVTVEMWSAGDVGRKVEVVIEGLSATVVGGGDGRAGSYLRASIDVEPGDTYAVRIGRGGVVGEETEQTTIFDEFRRVQGNYIGGARRIFLWGGSQDSGFGGNAPASGYSMTAGAGQLVTVQDVHLGQDAPYFSGSDCQVVPGSGAWNGNGFDQPNTDQCDSRCKYDEDAYDVNNTNFCYGRNYDTTDENNIKRPPYTGAGGCSSSPCNNPLSFGHQGVGGNGKIVIQCESNSGPAAENVGNY